MNFGDLAPICAKGQEGSLRSDRQAVDHLFGFHDVLLDLGVDLGTGEEKREGDKQSDQGAEHGIILGQRFTGISARGGVGRKSGARFEAQFQGGQASSRERFEAGPTGSAGLRPGV